MKKASLLLFNFFILFVNSIESKASDKEESAPPIFINEMGLTQLKSREENDKNLESTILLENQGSKVLPEANNNNFDYLLGHHSKFTPTFIENLVKKGKKALTAIDKDQIDDFPHKLEYFAGDLSDYGKHWFHNGLHGGYGLEELSKYISSEKYNKERELFILNRNAQMETFICVIWALTDSAFRKKQGFIRGAFSILDPDKKVSKYLEKFACFVAEVKSMEYHSEAIFNLFGSNIAYTRNKTSSHYVGLSKYQIGIDARFNTAQLSYGFFPFQMKHVLCGSVTNQSGKEKTFVKFEEEGLGDVRSIVSHFFYYSASTVNIDKRPDVRREKAILSPIAEVGKDLLLKLIEVHEKQFNEGSVTQPAPEWVFKIVKKYKKRGEKSTFFEESSHVDISRFYGLSKIYKSSKDEETKKLAEQLFSTILKYYDEETIEFRTGNEVMISLEEFSNKNPAL
jgi:hypothetical protein